MQELAPNDAHYTQVLREITKGRVVPFFGAGVNLCGRPSNAAWCPDGEYLPSGAELSGHLAESCGYPDKDTWDLLRVSQYVAVKLGPGPLYEDLHSVFDCDFLARSAGNSQRMGPTTDRHRH